MARAFLAGVIGAAAAAGVGPDEDLVMAGIDSGDLIRLALSVEERYDVQLEAGRLAELRTLRALADLLADLDPERTSAGTGS